jgi:O-antigen ligase
MSRGRVPREALQQRFLSPVPPPSAAQSTVDWLALLILVLPGTAGLVLYGGVLFSHSAPFLIAVYCAAALVFASRLVKPGRTLVRLPAGWLSLLVFAVLGAVLISYAVVPYEARVEVMKIFSYLLSYWAVYQLALIRGRWRICYAIPLIVGSLVVWYAIIQHAQESNLVLNQTRPERYGMRASGTLICPNHFAYALELLIISSAALLPIKSAGWSLRILAGYTFVLCIPVLLLTGSRSGWIGAAAGLSALVLLAAFRVGTRRFALAVVAVPVVVAAIGVGMYLGSPIVHDRVEIAIRGDIRPAIWQDTAAAIQDRPWFGHGPASYRWIYPKYKSVYRDIEKWPHYAHNEYLNTATDYGLVGVGLACLIGLIVGCRFLAAFIREKNSNAAWVCAGFLGCLVATAVHAVFDFQLHIFALAHLLVFFAAVTGGILSNTGSLRVRKQPVVSTIAVCVAGIGTCVFLTQLTARMLHSYLLTHQAEHLRKKELEYDLAQSVADRAIDAYPGHWRAHNEMASILKTRSVWHYDPARKIELAKQCAAALEDCIDRNPLYLDAMLELSRVYGDLLDDPERSIALLDEIIELAPTHFYYRAQLGLRLRRMGKDQEAFEVFRAARELNPKDKMIKLNLKKLKKKLKIKPGSLLKNKPRPPKATKER